MFSRIEVNVKQECSARVVNSLKDAFEGLSTLGLKVRQFGGCRWSPFGYTLDRPLGLKSEK